MKKTLSALGVGVMVRRLLGPINWGNNDLPVISLVTPSFNQSVFIGKTIESIGQGYLHLQYVVQDTESFDGTAEILNTYRRSTVDIRIEADYG